MTTKIFGGGVILSDRIEYGKSVYIRDGRIAAITEEELAYDHAIDARGHYVSPGLIDLHVHGALDCDFADGCAEAVIKAANYHASHGATTILPTVTSTSYEETCRALEAIRAASGSEELIPNLIGAHLEGPYFSKQQCGAQNPDKITPPVKADYQRLLQSYGDVIRRWSFAPELEGSAEFLECLAACGVVPSIGHSDALYEDVMMAYERGCRLITHFYSCTSTVTREKGFRRLGVIESGYLLDDVAVETIADGCHLPRELFSLIYKIKGRDQICLVSDAMRCCGSEKEISSIGGVPCKIKNGVAYLLDESAFAGSIASADRLLRFCVKDVGLSLFDAVAMMTETPARVMGLKRKGRLAPEFDADIVIFDEDIRIKNVLINGKEVLKYD